MGHYDEEMERAEELNKRAAAHRAYCLAVKTELARLVDGGNYLDYLPAIALEDVDGLKLAQESYGDSWKQRGGVGAFMMLARKWDRLEKQVSRNGYDVFRAWAVDQRPEGIIDDIRDLRRYLMLVEAETRVLMNRQIEKTLSNQVDLTEPEMG